MQSSVARRSGFSTSKVVPPCGLPTKETTWHQQKGEGQRGLAGPLQPANIRTTAGGAAAPPGLQAPLREGRNVLNLD